MVWPAFGSARENPYLRLLYEPLKRMGVDVRTFSIDCLGGTGRVPDIWHLHWPERLLRFSSSLGVLRRILRFRRRLVRAHARGIKICWTVHNVDHHERRHPLLAVIFWRMFLRRVDGCIHLSASGRELACKRHPVIGSIPGYVVPHMHYRQVYPDSIDRSAARAHLGLPDDTRVVLCIGQIRPYKNIPWLISAFRGIRDSQVRLLVVGKVNDGNLKNTIRRAAAGDERIHLAFGFIPDEALQIYFRAADFCVAPYRDILNSGSALLALSFGCPILAPDRGSLKDLATGVGGRWVRLYDGCLESRRLESELNEVWCEERAAPVLDRHDPQIVAEQTLAAYRSLTRAPS